MGDSDDDEVELIRRGPDNSGNRRPPGQWPGPGLYVSRNIETLRLGMFLNLEEFIDCEQIGTAPPPTSEDDPETVRAAHNIGSARVRYDCGNLLTRLEEDLSESKRRPLSVATAVGLCLWESSKYRDFLPSVSSQNTLIITVVRRAILAFVVCRALGGPLIRRKLIKDVAHVKSLVDNNQVVHKNHESALTGKLWRLLRWF